MGFVSHVGNHGGLLPRTMGRPQKDRPTICVDTYAAYVSSLPVDPVDFDMEKLVGLKETVWGTYWCEVAGGASCN